MIRKTAAITAASIAGVIIAGGAAVGANIGILNAADDNSLGNLSAQAPITTPAIASTTTLAPFVKVTDSSGSTQSFMVDTAGTVEVRVDDSGLHFSDVRTNQGWSWEKPSDSDKGTITVTFTSGVDKLEFSAALNDDGTISASVDRPISTSAPTQATVNSSPGYSDDDDDDLDEYEDKDDDHDEFDDDEYDD